VKTRNFSPKLTWLIEAAGQAKKDAADANTEGVARALEEFGALARLAVPARGVFVPDNDDIAIAIERVAKQHLALGLARKDFDNSLKVVVAFEQRDAIESAQSAVQAVCEKAYFYAGLAFGMTLGDLL
jgi:hypothetical protein